MDNALIEKLRSQVESLGKEAEALGQAAGDFPALSRNLIRIQACLGMMRLDLGLSALDGPWAQGRED